MVDSDGARAWLLCVGSNCVETKPLDPGLEVDEMNWPPDLPP
jgi:hypothetical protein